MAFAVRNLAAVLAAAIVLVVSISGNAAAEPGLFLRCHAGQAAENGRSRPLCDRADARSRKPRAAGRRGRGHRGARAHRAACPQCGRYDVRRRQHRRRRAARRRRARCHGRDRDAHLSAAARGRRAPAAHRLHGADQQVRHRAVLRRLSDRQWHEADALEQTRARRRAADFSVLGRARLQGDVCADGHGAATPSSRSATCRSCARSRSRRT